jgi:predicted transcriptional regulator
MAPKKTKSFRISPEIEAALAAAAAKADRSEGWIIEKALAEWLERRGMLPKDDHPTS